MKETIEKFNKLFKVAPVLLRVKDGSVVTVCHRVGAIGGSYTIHRLAEILGYSRGFGRRIASVKVRYAVQAYRKHLASFYKKQRLLPLFAFVRSGDSQELYLQGFADPKSSKLKVGAIRDGLLWCERILLTMKPWADGYGTAMGLSEA